MSARTCRLASPFFAVAILACGSAVSISCHAAPGVETTFSYTTQVKDAPIHVSSHAVGKRGEDDVEYRAGETLVSYLPFKSALFRPVDAEFIGVTNFSPESGRIPTPAHAIGASFAEAVFRGAAAETPKDSNTGKRMIRDHEIGPSRIALSTDLRMNPTDPTWRANEIATVLELLEEPVQRYSQSDSLPKDGLWPYLGGAFTTGYGQSTISSRGEPLTKRRILEIASLQASRLAHRREGDERVTIFYLATHGRLGPDGKRYAMAADSTRDLSTWIRYDEIADLYRGPEKGKATLSALVLFDTCLESEDPAPVGDPYVPPDGTAVISAAAPGEYSWHWGSSTRVDVLKDVNGASRKRPLDGSFYTSMSVLPLAISSFLLDQEVDCNDHPKNKILLFTSADLMNALVTRVPKIADSMPGRRRQTTELLMSARTRADVEADSFEYVALFAMPCVAMSPDDVEAIRNRNLIASSRLAAEIRGGRK